jgi:hypothetical protein
MLRRAAAMRPRKARKNQTKSEKVRSKDEKRIRQLRYSREHGRVMLD